MKNKTTMANPEWRMKKHYELLLYCNIIALDFENLLLLNGAFKK